MALSFSALCLGVKNQLMYARTHSPWRNVAYSKGKLVWPLWQSISLLCSPKPGPVLMNDWTISNTERTFPEHYPDCNPVPSLTEVKPIAAHQNKTRWLKQTKGSSFKATHYTASSKGTQALPSCDEPGLVALSRAQQGEPGPVEWIFRGSVRALAGLRKGRQPGRNRQSER